MGKGGFFKSGLRGARIITRKSVRGLVRLRPSLVVTFSSSGGLGGCSRVTPAITLAGARCSCLRRRVRVKGVMKGRGRTRG